MPPVEGKIYSMKFVLFRRQKRSICAAIAALLLVVVGIACTHIGPRSLVSRSTDVADTSAWWLTGPHLSTEYQWVGTSRILYVVPDNRQYGEFKLRLLDVSTGHNSALDPLTQTFNAHRGMWTTLPVSPSGKWIGWSSEGNAGWCNLDGKELHEIQFENQDPDDTPGIDWPQNDGGPLIIRKPEESPDAARVITAYSADLHRETRLGRVPERFIGGLHANTIRLASNGDIVIACSEDGSSDSDTIIVRLNSDKRQSAHAVKSDEVDHDSHSFDGPAALSFDGRHVAWVSTSPITRPTQVLDRILHSGLRMKGYEATLWISDIDGTNKRIVGTERDWNVNNPRDLITFVKWQPGDKVISYIHENHLYTITVN